MHDDDNIQNDLEAAGKGLPSIDALILRYAAFPFLKTVLSWDVAMNLFEREGKRIVSHVKDLDQKSLFQRVLVPKTFGIEDNSRYYSPAMILWHLQYVGETIGEGVVTLSKNEHLDIVVKIENFKPYVEIAPDIVSKFEHFIANFRNNVEKGIVNKSVDNTLSHPWFGDLNPHAWIVLAAIHQMVHGRQLKKVLKLNR